MNSRLAILLTGFLLLFLAEAVVAQRTTDTRVTVVTIDTGNADPQIAAALRAAGDTMALTLRLLGDYAVKTDFSLRWTDADAYLEGLELGAVDRIIVLQASRKSGNLILEATVVNPLDGSVEISRREELPSILILFDSVDRITAGLLGELSGERIAFGSIDVTLAGWDVADLSDLALHGIPFVPEPTGPPVEERYALRVDGVRAGTGLEVERILIGDHALQVIELETQRVVAERDVTVEEGSWADISVTAPVLSAEAIVRLAETVRAVNEARAEWRKGGSETELQRWHSAIQIAREALPTLPENVAGRARWERTLELEEAAAKLAEIDLATRTEWNEPNRRWLAEVEAISADVAQSPEEVDEDGAVEAGTFAPLVDEIGAEAERLRAGIPQLYSLAAVAALRDQDLARVEEWYLSPEIPHPPQWFQRDRALLNLIYSEYREERPDRRGLYRLLNWGGVGIALGGGASWGMGASTSQEASELYDEYRATTDVTESTRLREETQEKDSQARVLQGGGIVLAATGVVSFLTGLVVRRRDQSAPERLLEARLRGYFGPRLEMYRTIANEELLDGVPIAEFEQAVREAPDEL